MNWRVITNLMVRFLLLVMEILTKLSLRVVGIEQLKFILMKRKLINQQEKKYLEEKRIAIKRISFVVITLII